MFSGSLQYNWKCFAFCFISLMLPTKFQLATLNSASKVFMFSPFLPSITTNMTVVSVTLNAKDLLQFSTHNCSRSLVVQIQHQTFSRQRLCPALRTSLVISCLGCHDSLGSHTPSSLRNSSVTRQHASSSTSTDPPMLSPSYSSSAGCLYWIQNPAALKQGRKGMHTCTTRPLCMSTHTSPPAFLPPLATQITILINS